MDIDTIKKKQILEISKITKYGLLKLNFELYFIAEVFKIVSKSAKIDIEPFVCRLAKIIAKDQ